MPIKYTPKQLYEIGEKSNDWSWSDEELDQQIDILETIIPYLRGRKDSGIIVSLFNREIENMKSIRLFRKIHNL